MNATTPKRRRKIRTTRIPFTVTTLSFVVALAAFITGVRLWNGSTPEPCANTRSCQYHYTEIVENDLSGTFMGQPVEVPAIAASPGPAPSTVLGDSDHQIEKHIYVDLSRQKLFAVEGDTTVFETWVSTGRWGWTPTGNFRIWSKLRSTRMSGGSGADYYDLPNVPYVMYFYRDFGLHGAYWHNNFGHTMSHGCVNLRPIDAEVLFNWADGPDQGSLGTWVSVCDNYTAPDICIQENPVTK